MNNFKALLLTCTLTLLPTFGHAADAPALTDAQKKEVEAVVRDMLTKKEPEILIKAAQVLQEKADAEASVKEKESMSKNMEKIYNDPNSPVAGNPKGDVTVVEFFDYSCGYCKMAHEHVVSLLNADKNVRFVYKEFPILGPKSTAAAKAALASVAQGKYVKFHEALMTSKEALTDESILSLAKSSGLDTDKLKKEMESDKVAAMLKDNAELGRELGVRGTPTFIIGDKIVGFDQLKSAVETARKDKKK